VIGILSCPTVNKVAQYEIVKESDESSGVSTRRVVHVNVDVTDDYTSGERHSAFKDVGDVNEEGFIGW